MSKKPDHSHRSHSELPPSSADKWLNCWDWLRSDAQHRHKFGTAPSGAAAQEGTQAHEVFEQLIKGLPQVPKTHAHKRTAAGRKDYKDATNAKEYDNLEACLNWVDAQPGVIYPELNVDFGQAFGYVGLTGTSDVTVTHPRRLTIADLKYGRYLVEVEDEQGNPNMQLMCYLIGAIEMFGPRDEYAITILQPRASHPKGPIRQKILTPADVAIAKYDIETSIDANFSRKHKPTPGPWCRPWCNALPTCRAVVEQSLDLLRNNPPE